MLAHVKHAPRDASSWAAVTAAHSESDEDFALKNDQILAPAVVFGCRKPGWGIIRALGQANIPVIGAYYDSNDIGCASRYLSSAVQCPHPEQAEDEFRAFVTQLGDHYPRAVMIPSDDYSLVALSRMQDSAGQVRIAAPAYSIVEQCIEKDRTYELAGVIGVRAPRTVIVTSLKDALEQATGLGFPCLLKPAVGHRFYAELGVKMYRVGSAAELQEIWAQAADTGGELLIQEYIPGGDDHGVNYNAMWQAGKPCVEITAAKRRLSPRGIGFPTVVANDFIPEIIEPARKILAALGYHGFANVEFKRDANSGEYVLMEINARLNLSLLLSVATGMNFAAMLYQQRLGKRIGDWSHVDPYRHRYYYIDTWQDMREALYEIGSGKLSIANFLAPYCSRHVSATLSLSDPLPVLRHIFVR